MIKGKFWGSVLIIIGTAVGAGMLALPLVTPANGFILSSLLLITIWALMTCTALLILEVNLAFKPYKNNFGSMALVTLGPIGQFVVCITSLALLYSLAAAYISGGASLISVKIQSILAINISPWLCAILFTIILGSAVFWSTKAVDHLNRNLVIIKGILLIATLAFLAPYVHFDNLIRTPNTPKYLLACAPIFLCSLAFHHIIPTITNYIGPKPKMLKKIIIYGSTIPLCIYIFWLGISLGVIPLFGNNSFKTLALTNGSVGEFIQILVLITKSKWIDGCISWFANLAMVTSFLGVTLGLFDFLADTCKRLNNRFGRLQTALLTFIPPLIFAIVYPKGFVMALGYAAIFVAILQIILPVLMVQYVRKSTTLSSPFRMAGGNSLLVIVTIAGCALITIQIANILNLLPTF